MAPPSPPEEKGRLELNLGREKDAEGVFAALLTGVSKNEPKK